MDDKASGLVPAHHKVSTGLLVNSCLLCCRAGFVVMVKCPEGLETSTFLWKAVFLND